MNNINISKHTAAKIVKSYYLYHYYDLVDVKVKPKIVQNDLYMIVRIQSVVNHKKIVEIETINEGQIYYAISEYMKLRNCDIKNIIYEPYFHNLLIDYDGDFTIENKKGFMKKKGAI